MPSYYDIDAILAEEDLIPCTTCFDFAFLAWLDPNSTHLTADSRKRNRDGEPLLNSSILPEGNKVHMPLWAIEKWSTLSFVRVSVPKHYTRKVRERFMADPVHAPIRMSNEQYFFSAALLVQLIERCQVKVQADLRKNNRSNNSGRMKNLQRRNQHAQAVQVLHNDAQDLRKDILLLFSGSRLRCTLDWTLFTSMEEDVSQYSIRLTEMERQLFVAGAAASKALYEWKNYGGNGFSSRRMSSISKAASSTADAVPRAVSPDAIATSDSVAAKGLRMR